jgi:hypothetical protein
MRILAYSLEEGGFTRLLPVDYKVLHVGNKNDEAKIWVQTNQNLDIACPHISVRFNAVRTGEEYEGEYIGSFNIRWTLYHLIKI